jgi:type IV secretion system protein VirD4
MAKESIGKAVLNDLMALPKNILKPYYKNGKLNANKVAIDAIPFSILFYAVNKYMQAVMVATGDDFLDKCVNAFSIIFQVKPYFLPSFKLVPLLCGIGAGAAFKLYMDSRKKNAKQYRHGEEYGSAKWGTDKDFEPYTDENKWNNIPLTATEWLRMTRPEHPKYDRNKNILIVGGSGAGKTRGFVKPNLMQMHSSYVITDPKGIVCKGQSKKH